MLRIVTRTISLATAGFSILIVAFMFFVARGEWKCGLHTLQITLANLIGAAGLSVAIILWRHTAPASKRFSYRIVLSVCAVLGTVTLFVFMLAPPCPFPSR